MLVCAPEPGSVGHAVGMPALAPLSPSWRRVPLPEPPRYDLWPVALRSAWRLKGALVPCGPGYRGIAWPETPRVRLTTLAPWLADDRVACHLTAAWVWGAARHPGDPLQFSMTRGQRKPTTSDVTTHIHEFRLVSADIHTFGRLSVTTPERTALDLLHSPEGFGRTETVALRLLCQQFDGGVQHLRQHLSVHKRPYRRLAERRLARLSGR